MVNELMNMKKRYLTIGKILLIVIGIVVILYLSLRIFAEYAFSIANPFEPLGGIHEGYSYNEIKEYFYTNKENFDVIETAVMSIIDSNIEKEPDNFSTQRQYIKQFIDSLLPSKPENFAVCINKNALFITMGAHCAWQGWCCRKGYMWTSISFDDVDENGWVKDLDPVFSLTIQPLSEKWFYYVYDRLTDHKLGMECQWNLE